MPRKKEDFTNHPWDVAAATPLKRQSTPQSKLQDLDPGVNFFVLALEALGATPHFSCEGHTRGFYVLFSAPYELALDIRNAGYFSVQIEDEGTWSIRKTSAEYVEYAEAPYTEKDKVWLLRAAADAWLRHFGDRLATLYPSPQPFA